MVIFALALFGCRGLWVGFVRQIASMLALVLAFVVAGQYYGRSADLVTPFVSNPRLGFLVAYGLIFSFVFFAIIFIGLALRKVVKFTLLGWVDHSLGGILGCLKALFVSCIAFMVLAVFISGNSTIFTRSRLYPMLERSTMIILMTVRDHDLRLDLLPRQPAISEALDSTVKFGQDIGRQTKEITEQD